MQEVISYIDKSPWREELLLLREIILETGLTETIKWGAPCYMLGKDNVVGLASFKSYAGLWFFQGGLLKDEGGYLMNAQEGKTKAMRQWRFYHTDAIREAPVKEYIQESIVYFSQHIKIAPDRSKVDVALPDELRNALEQDGKLMENWEKLSPGCKREYAGYIAEARKTETRVARVLKIIPLILELKTLNERYKK